MPAIQQILNRLLCHVQCVLKYHAIQQFIQHVECAVPEKIHVPIPRKVNGNS